MLGFERYWGKVERPTLDESDCSKSVELAYHPLVYHSLDVAAVLKVLLDQSPLYQNRLSSLFKMSYKEWSPTIVWLMALHDVGKFAPPFQALVPEVRDRLKAPLPEPGFEAYEPRHDAVGTWLLVQLIANKIAPRKVRKELGVSLDFLTTLLTCSSSHHGMPTFLGNDATLSRQLQPALADVQKWMDASRELLAPDALDVLLRLCHTNNNIRQASWLLNGLMTFADWVGSNQSWFPYIQTNLSLEDYWATSCEQADTALRATGFLSWPVVRAPSFERLFPAIAKTPTPLQQLASSIPITEQPQLFVLEDLTGAGKTEAALTLAARLIDHGQGEGIFMALPTMATANAMFSRMNDAAGSIFPGNPSLVLAHGRRSSNSVFRELIHRGRNDQNYNSNEWSASAICTAWLADGNKRALLGQVGIGTIDQALLGILRAKHATLRLFGLARQILIIDEVHACDAYMNELLTTLLRFHAGLGGSAILLSATLPKSTRQSLIQGFTGTSTADDGPAEAFPLLTRAQREHESAKLTPVASNNSRSLPVQLVNDIDTVLEKIKEVSATGSVCWIRNTVADATAGAQLLRSKSVPEVSICHSRFIVADRLEKEEELLYRVGKKSGQKNRKGYVVVATQVVEQSLDVDFDLVISDLSPMDSLLQRAGRMRRHRREANGNPIAPGDMQVERRPTQPMLVLSPSLDGAEDPWYGSLFPKGKYVYSDEEKLWLTAHVIARKGRFSLPDDARELIESVYGDVGDYPPAPDHVIARSDQALGKQISDRSIAHYQRNDFDLGIDKQETGWSKEERAMTRLIEPTTTFRLLAWDNGSLQRWDTSGDSGWAGADVSIRGLHLEPVLPVGLEIEEVKNMCEKMPGKGRWITPLPLAWSSTKQIWQGAYTMMRHDKKILYSVNYCKKYGFVQTESGESN